MKNSIAKMEAFHKQLTLGNVTNNAIKVYKSLLENPQTIHSMRPNLGMAHQSLTATLSHLEDIGWVYKDSTTKVKGNSFTLYKAEISSNNAMLRAQEMQEHKYNEWIKRGKKNGWIQEEQAKEIEKERLAETWIAALEYGITNLKSFNNLTSEEAFEYGITNLKDFNNLTSEEAFENFYNETYGGNND